MKLCIRAHDLGVKGTEEILNRLTQLGLDGVQMVCYKAYEDIPYAPGGIKDLTVEQCLFSHTDRGLRIKTRRGRGKYAVIDGV